MPFNWLIPKCVNFDRDDLEKIVHAAVGVAADVPWTIDGTEEFTTLLRRAGCKIQGTKVSFPKKLIEKTLERIGEEKAKRTRRSTPAFAGQEITYSASGQALWCCDAETDRLRPSTKQDLAVFSRIVNTFPDLDRTHPTFIPTDAPLKTRDLHAYVTIMLNSDRPYRVSCYSPETLDYFIEANSIYYGSRERGIENLLLPAKVWINTPFMISRESIEAAMKLRRIDHRPLTFTAMPVCGVATPVTPDGALTLITAEVLGINAISLAVDDEVAEWPSAPLAFDFKNAIHTQWGPETVLIFTACLQVAAHLFGTPSSGVWAAAGTSAKVPGEQSMMERSFGFGMAFVAGIRNFGGLGTLAFSDVGSSVQLVLDMELVSAMKSFVKGFEVSEETMAEAAIKRSAPEGAHFMESEHTFDYYRKCQWFPELMDRRVPGAYQQNPVTMLERARKKAEGLIKNAPNLCPMNDSQKKELLKLVKSADRKLS